MGKKIAIILTGVVGILLVVAFIGWQFIKVSPQYSVYQIYQATSQHDYEKFKKYVDVEGISNNVIDKALAQATESTTKDTSNNDPFYQLGQTIGIGLINSMKPQLKEKMTTEIKKAVEEGTFKTAYKPKNIFGYFNTVQANKDGKVATVTIKTQGKDDLTFKMRDLGGYWQIFDMELPVPEVDTTKSPTETTFQAKYGERVDIGSGWYLTVEAPAEYKPTGYSTPKEGNKYVAVKITYENTTNAPDSYSTYNFKLKDDKDFSYSDTYGGKDPSIESGDLEANGKVTGYMTFEIPQDNNPKSLIYSGSKSVVFSPPQQ
ncbi:MAG: DUF4352 domain-containing protein [Patescibacteria group bacterium]|nr:DUF4352 domain-containing protein [Patescibacteria group bacterium]